MSCVAATLQLHTLVLGSGCLQLGESIALEKCHACFQTAVRKAPEIVSWSTTMKVMPSRTDMLKCDRLHNKQCRMYEKKIVISISCNHLILLQIHAPWSKMREHVQLICRRSELICLSIIMLPLDLTGPVFFGNAQSVLMCSLSLLFQTCLLLENIYKGSHLGNCVEY